MTSDHSPIAAFANVAVTDSQVGALDTVTVTMSNPADGTLSDPLGGTINAGTFTVSATPTSSDFGFVSGIYDVLDGLIFTPTRGQVPLGESVTTEFTIVASNDLGLVTDASTSVIATATGGQLAINGAQANQEFSDDTNVLPLAGVTITDTQPTPIDTATVTLSNPASGVLTAGNGGTVGADGVFRITDPLGQVQAALQAIGFTPAGLASGQIATSWVAIGVTDGTLSATDATTSLDVIGTGTLSVGGTVGPTLHGEITLGAATEGAVLPDTTEVASFTDSSTIDAAGVFSASIDWGDGTTTAGTVNGEDGSFIVTGGHTYAEEGDYPLDVTVTDTADAEILPLSGTVAVADAPLTATGANVVATEGASTGQVTVATFTDANPDATAADFTATIDWGDGTSSAGTVAVDGGGFSVDGAHTYAEEGQYTVGVSIDDQGGSTAGTSGTAMVADAALTATAANVTAAAGASTGQVTVATFTDANPDATAADFTATIAWGDGTTSAGTIAALSGGGFSVDGTHSYAEEGQYTVGVSIDDKGGSTADTSGTAMVSDGPPAPILSGTLANIGVVDETPLTPFSALTVTDAGAGDTDTVAITLANPAFGVLSNPGAGSYDSNTGVYTVTGTPSAVTTAIDGLEITPTAPAANVFLTSTALTLTVTGPGGGPAPQSAIVASVQQVLNLAAVPVSDIAISVSADGTGLAASNAGNTNEAAVTSPTTGDTYTLPAGYQAEYLGGSTNATLQDTDVGNAVLVGNTGNDVLIAGAANDSIVSGNGNNTLQGGSGAIALLAGNGNDSITTATDSTYTIDLGSGADTVLASGTGTVTGGTGSDLIDATGTGPSADDLIVSQGPQGTVLGGAGDLAVLDEGSHDTVLGRAGALTVVEEGAHDTIQAAGGPTNVTLNGSFGRTRGGTGTFTVDDPTANTTVIGGTAGTMFVTVGAAASDADVFGRAGNTNILDLGADALMGAGGGTSVVTIDGAGTQLYGNSPPGGTLDVSIGAANVLAFGLGDNTTIDASSAAATGALVYGGFSSIAGDNGSLLVKAGADSLVAVTGGSNATIDAGTGGLYTFIGTGSLAGSNVINGASASQLYTAFIGGAGSATVYGGEAGASVFGVDGTDATYVNTRTSAPGAYLVANGSAAGGETLNAAGSATNDSLFAAQGNVSLVAGSGSDLLSAGANTGSVGGAGTVVGGDTIMAGGGSDLMLFTHGTFIGGAVVINFSSLSDTVFLSGYNAAAGGNQAAMALAGATESGENTTIALTDGTHITFVDATTTQLQGHVFSS
jgi:hypothetical protein